MILKLPTMGEMWEQFGQKIQIINIEKDKIFFSENDSLPYSRNLTDFAIWAKNGFKLLEKT